MRSSVWVASSPTLALDSGAASGGVDLPIVKRENQAPAFLQLAPVGTAQKMVTAYGSKPKPRVVQNMLASIL